MKQKISLLTLSLIALTSVTHAGPPPEFFARFAKPVKSTAQIIVQTPSTPMPCDACKIEDIREPRYHAPMSKGMPDMVLVGSKHQCARCGGTITNFRGKVDNRMKTNCPTCQKAVCCAPAQVARL